MTGQRYGAPGRAPEPHILVVAKAPVAGRVKTRLCPPLSPDEAARVAAAALADTLDAVAGSRAARRVLALDGAPGDWIPPGFEVLSQRGSTFAERLAHAWADAGGPGLQIGMDTPQVTAGLLDACLDLTFGGEVTASLGLAADGGWWAIGRVDDWKTDIFDGVPMSTSSTGSAQLRRLRAEGHTVGMLPELIDVDRIGDVQTVASLCPPHSRFAAVTA